MLIILILTALGLVAWGCLALASAITMKVEARRRWVSERFKPDEIHIDDAGRFLAVRFSDDHLIYGTYGWAAAVPFNALTSVEVFRNGVTVTKTNRGSQVAGAAIGGLAFGLAGAVVGSLSGTTTAQELLRSISLRLTFDHREHPATEVTFGVWPGNGVLEDGVIAGSAIRSLERFRGIAQIALRAEP